MENGAQWGTGAPNGDVSETANSNQRYPPSLHLAVQVVNLFRGTGVSCAQSLYDQVASRSEQ